uniref:Ictacalcin n=1 Tax=Sparus aurata TaxID=8175 RepID=A0A671UM73_SPAAU
MQKAIALVIETFRKYSGREGDPTTLTKAELKELLQNELGELVGKAPDKAAVDRIFSDLDSNQDNLVDFAEFGLWILVVQSGHTTDGQQKAKIRK